MMEPAEDDIYTIAGRLATFERPHHLSKRRASQTTAKKKAQPTSITWPHASPTPEQLARAGFYYRPASNSHDSVTCFLCDKALDGWDPQDNPALEHLSHVPECGWAINICIEQRSSQAMDTTAEEHPLSEKMCEARRATFRDIWPHQSKKGWKCKLDKMVQAGWCYSPLPEADDCVQCFYCGVSLDGWEPKDDPWDEHQRRAPDCHFFTLVDQAPKPKPAPKSKTLKQKSKAKSSRASKTSRASTQSNLTHVSDVTSLDLEDTIATNNEEDNDDTVLTVTSTTSKAGNKGRKKAPAAKSRTTRAKKNSTMDDSIMHNTEDTALEATLQDESAVEQSVAHEVDTSLFPAKKPRAARAKKTSTLKAKQLDVEEPGNDIPQIDESLASIDAPAVLPQPKARVKKQAAKKMEETPQEASQQVSHASDALAPQAPVRKVSKAKGSKKTQIIEPEEQSAPVEEPTQPKKRGKKRTSDGMVKRDSSVVELQPETIPDPSQTKQNASKRGRTTSRATKKSTAPKAEIESEDLVSAAAEPHQGIIKDSTPRVRATRSSRQLDEDADKPNSAQPLTERDPHSQPKQRQEERVAPPTPAADPPIQSVASSPQSSDAENHPPSSRPSTNTSAESAENPPTCIPLKPSTPTTSPSKRNKIAGLTSTAPWSATDLETVFLLSPSSRAAKDGPDKENASVEEVIQRLTSPEKKMSVEEWILWNAGRAEENLKAECERLIGLFEGEGVRALQALEGIECV